MPEQERKSKAESESCLAGIHQPAATAIATSRQAVEWPKPKDLGIHNEGSQRVGPYQFNWKDCLGNGVVGTAFLGHHVNDKSKVVIRVTHQDDLQDTRIKQMVDNDRDMVLRFQDHKNVIKFFYYMEIKPYFYSVVEFCEHTSLERYMEKEKPNKKSKLCIMRQCAELLQYLHGQNPTLIHRCLQPELILLKGDVAKPDVKLIDFYYAVDKRSGEEMLTEMVGSQNYMAPEMFLFEVYDEKVDVFSLGCIFLAMINFGKTNSLVMQPYPESKLQSQLDLSKTKPLGLELVESEKRRKKIGTILDTLDVGNYDWWNEVKEVTVKMLVYKPVERATAEEANKTLQQISG